MPARLISSVRLWFICSWKSTATASLQVRNIVDGQQRLATLQVLMAALRCVAVEAEAQDSQYHIERLLVNDQRRYKEYDRLKVLPTTGDRDVFQEIVIKAVDYEPGNQYTHAVKEAKRNSKGFVGAFNFYREISRQFCTGDDGSLVPEQVDRLVHAVSRGLSVAVIDLKSGDDPQAIFECLNARGAPLRAMDLLKNHLLGGISSESGYCQWMRPIRSGGNSLMQTSFGRRKNGTEPEEMPSCITGL